MNSQVLKLLIDNKSKAVFGVRLKKGDSVYTVLARKEVILSAGTLNSAQLLMLSGQLDAICCFLVLCCPNCQFLSVNLILKVYILSFLTQYLTPTATEPDLSLTVL